MCALNPTKKWAQLKIGRFAVPGCGRNIAMMGCGKRWNSHAKRTVKKNISVQKNFFFSDLNFEVMFWVEIYLHEAENEGHQSNGGVGILGRHGRGRVKPHALGFDENEDEARDGRGHGGQHDWSMDLRGIKREKILKLTGILW